MKNVYLITILLVFFIFALTPLKVHAEIMSATTPASTSSTTYKLAYPGMLPDHPLYKLKLLRDKIMLSLMQDPIRKAEYYLLLADKQIAMSALLVDKGNIQLAKEIALKGENQYTAITFLFKDTGTKPSQEFYDRLIGASQEHQKILRSVASKLDADDKKIFETVLEFSTRNADEINKIFNQQSI
ncbi:hypothetical protein HY947_03270 [Candidatus Gottesmanbacteria bacterium]|nr:hypothetical protein [Candidatus Gottesmanbacteria bacterium]